MNYSKSKPTLLVISQLFNTGGLETRLNRLLGKLKDVNVIFIIMGDESDKLHKPLTENDSITFLRCNDIQNLNESLLDIIITHKVDIVELQICGVKGYDTLNYELLKSLNIQITCTIHFNIYRNTNHHLFGKFKGMLNQYFDYVITNRPLDNQYLKHNNYHYIPNTSLVENNTVYESNDSNRAIIILRLWKDNLQMIESYIQFLQKHNIAFDIAGDLHLEREKELQALIMEKYDIKKESFIGNIDTISFLQKHSKDYLFICGVGSVALESLSIGFPVLLASTFKRNFVVKFFKSSNYAMVRDDNFTIPRKYYHSNADNPSIDLQKILKGDLGEFLLSDKLIEDGLTPGKVLAKYTNLLLSSKESLERNSSYDIKCSVVINNTSNGTQGLKRTIQSALNQSQKDIEIIVLNSSPRVNANKAFQSFIKADNRVKYVSCQACDLGKSMLRNKGIKISRGEYIAFLDSGDSMTANFISNLYKDITAHEADIAKCNQSHGPLNEGAMEFSHNYGVYSSKQDKDQLLWFGSWNALYKKDFLLENYLYFNGNQDRELNFVYRAFKLANKIVYLNSDACYLVSSKGSSISIMGNILYSIIKIFKR